MALLKRGQCDPLKERGRNGTALAGTLNGKQTTIGSASLGLEFRQVMQSSLAAEIGRRIAHRFDAQGTPFFEVLLDPRVLVEDVDDDVHATRDHPGRKRAVGVGSDPTTEDQLHFVGAAQIEVVGNECLEEAAGPSGCIEHQGARDFDLAHRELPPVASLLIGGIQWCGDNRHPAIEEGLEVGRAGSITDGLQASGVSARSEAVGQLGKGQPVDACLALGPLMPVCPNFAGIREVGAQLDEAEPELCVGNVEVVDGDAAVLFDEGVVRSTRARFALLGRAIVGSQDGLELLSDADGDDARLSGGLEVGLDQVYLPIAPGEADDRDLTLLGESGDCSPKGLAHFLEQGWGGNWLVTLPVEKGDHLAANLQRRNVGVQVDTIQAFEVQQDMPVEHFIDVADPCHTYPRKTPGGHHCTSHE